MSRFIRLRLPSAAANVGVTADPWNDSLLRIAACRIGQELGLPVTDGAMRDGAFVLTVTPDRLEIRQCSNHRGHRPRPVCVDLDRLDTTSPAGRNGRQPLARAVAAQKTSSQSLVVVDATAGFGADAWLLASLGCRVIAFERCHVVAALLSDALRRAGQTNPRVADRIQTVAADARQGLAGLRPRPDVVYIDTMFPPRRKSALERRPMRVLREIVGTDPDQLELFDVAIRAAVRRVVVKRPLHAEPLVNRPAWRHPGKSLRYDVYSAVTAGVPRAQNRVNARVRSEPLPTRS